MKLLATTFALFGTLHANGQELIWSVHPTVETGGNEAGAGPLPNRVIGFDHVSDPDFTTEPRLNPVTGIFSMIITTNDAGRTFFANATNEPGFASFVAGLTDGANDYFRAQVFAPPFTGWLIGREAAFLRRSPAAPDLAGYNITQIGFRVNNYYDWFYAPEHRYLNTFDYSLDFYGAPILFVRRSGASQVEVSWTTNASGFTLQSASTLPSSSWSSVTNFPQIVGGRLAVSLDMTFQQRFFRLHKE